MTGRAPGSPYDRGDSDAYYRRAPSPHRWNNTLDCERDENLTTTELDEYWLGYNQNPSGEKDY